MTFYYFLRAVEVLVTIFVGFKLITQTYELRWNNYAVKIGLWVVILLLSIVEFLNSFWFKFSGIEYVYIFSAFFVLIIIFYRIPFLKASVYCMIYWENIFLIHFTVLLICSKLVKQDVDEYNTSLESIDAIYLLKMGVIVILVLLLYRLRSGKEFFKLNKRNDYIYLLGILILEWIAILRFFSKDRAVFYDKGQQIMLGIFLIIGLISMGCFYIIYSSYLAEKRQTQLLGLKYLAVETQYKYMLENYSTKRRQNHDAVQQYTLLKKYICSDKIKEACDYIDEIQNKINVKGMKIGIGIEEIDFILDCKITEIEKSEIRLRTDLDVCFCPLGHDDVCVLLGNLLDNSIEAVKKIFEKERREIFLKLRTVNNIFLLEIKNPYIGTRRMSNNKYLTTKEDKGLHGLGLESCRSIVESYGGVMEISDENNQFIVQITIFGDKRAKKQN